MIESQTNGYDRTIPIAFFDNVRSVVPENQELTLPALQQLLETHTNKVYPTKEDAPLFAATRFNGTRNAANATESGLIPLDIDNGLTYDDARSILQHYGLQVIMYSSAFHQKAKDEIVRDRFRALFPLTDRVTPEQHREIAKAIARWLLVEADNQGMKFDPVWRESKTDPTKGKWEPYPDTSKIGIESIFFVPGAYPGVNNRYDVIDGDILTADDWLTLAPASTVPSERLQEHPGRDAFANLFDCMREATRLRFEPNCQDSDHQDWTFDQIAKMVQSISSYHAEDRDSWFDVGCALKAVLGDNGLGLFTDFSRTSAKHGSCSDSHLRSQYRSFKGHCHSVGTLIHFAKEGGWKDPHFTDWRAYDEWYESQSLVSQGPTRPIQDNGFEDMDLGVLTETPEIAEPEVIEPALNEPVNIFGLLRKEPVLRRDMLPPRIGDFAFDVAERLGAEPEIAAISALIVCASVTDDGIKLQPKKYDTEWRMSARLWGGPVGNSGLSKSPSMDAAVKPTIQIEKEWAEQDTRLRIEYEKKMIQYEEALRQYKKAVSGGDYSMAEYPEEPEEPPIRQLKVQWSTMEALAIDVLRFNPRGVLSHQDELAFWINSFDAYKGKPSGDQQLALMLRNGGMLTINRRNQKYVVPNFGSSVLGGIQESVIREAAPKLKGDGFLQRLLMFKVTNRPEDIDRVPDSMAISAYHCVVRQLAYFNAKERSPDDEITVRISDAARPYFDKMRAISRALCVLPGLPEAFRGFANKLLGTFCEMLLTMHMIECTPKIPMIETMEVTPEVSEATAKMACDLMVEFFIPHAVNLYTDWFGADGVTECETDAQWIAGHILAKNIEHMTGRDLARATRQFQGDKNKARVARAMEVLVSAKWVEPDDKGWTINPLVYVRFSERAGVERQQRATFMATMIKAERVIAEQYL